MPGAGKSVQANATPPPVSRCSPRAWHDRAHARDAAAAATNGRAVSRAAAADAGGIGAAGRARAWAGRASAAVAKASALGPLAPPPAPAARSRPFPPPPALSTNWATIKGHQYIRAVLADASRAAMAAMSQVWPSAAAVSRAPRAGGRAPTLPGLADGGRARATTLTLSSGVRKGAAAGLSGRQRHSA